MDIHRNSADEGEHLEDEPESNDRDDDSEAQINSQTNENTATRQSIDRRTAALCDGGGSLCSGVFGGSGTDGRPIPITQLARVAPPSTPTPSPTRSTAAASRNPPVSALAVRVTAAPASVPASAAPVHSRGGGYGKRGRDRADVPAPGEERRSSRRRAPSSASSSPFPGSPASRSARPASGASASRRGCPSGCPCSSASATSPASGSAASAGTAPSPASDRAASPGSALATPPASGSVARLPVSATSGAVRHWRYDRRHFPLGVVCVRNTPPLLPSLVAGFFFTYIPLPSKRRPTRVPTQQNAPVSGWRAAERQIDVDLVRFPWLSNSQPPLSDLVSVASCMLILHMYILNIERNFVSASAYLLFFFQVMKKILYFTAFFFFLRNCSKGGSRGGAAAANAARRGPVAAKKPTRARPRAAGTELARHTSSLSPAGG